eukprot:3641238-Rhodomonas_salina.1
MCDGSDCAAFEGAESDVGCVRGSQLPDEEEDVMGGGKRSCYLLPEITYKQHAASAQCVPAVEMCTVSARWCVYVVVGVWGSQSACVSAVPDD